MLTNEQLAIQSILKRLEILETREIEDSGWIGVPYTTGATVWADYGAGGFNNGEYRKIGDIVYVRGECARTSGANNTIFTLPTGFRPPARLMFNVNRTDSFSSVDMYSTGACTLRGGLGAGYTFISINFYFSVV